MKRHTRIRRHAIAAVAAISALMLSGCAVGGGTSAGSADGGAKLSDKPVTISLYWWGSASRVTSTEAAVKLFEKAHPNITVKMQSTDWGSYWDKLATSVAGGQAPDVMQFDQVYVASYAQRGALADLGEYSKYLDTSYLSKNVRDTGEYNSKLYALPIGLNSIGVAINKSVFDKYGVKVPDTTSWTWDDLTAVAKKITKASDGKVLGLDPLGGDSVSLTLWARQHGNALFNQKGDVVLKPSVLTDYWEYSLDQIKSGITPSPSQLAEGSGATIDQTDLAAGKVAMAFIPSNLTAYQVAAPDEKLDMLPFPSDSNAKKGWQYLKSSMYWTLSSKSAHPAEAAELIDYLSTNSKVGSLFGAERGTPANPSFQKEITPDLAGSDKIVMNYIKQATAESGTPAPITPVGGQDADSLLSQYWQNVQFGKATPQQAAQQYIAQLKKEIAAAKS
ncbi:sugar ABC transporter substrate-binding protein [Planctomonas sp. JC2975]|uniref:ABC transporter substrate-binding protein n=1 Tax=Planctomonas sp. JC2975 TaxID=2729626 RepID=UPI00147409C3|nr:sugar ABC transporter substrate-binding protein [Planctomonas sp. JC2975]NNC12772.1 sugar ABC transporter substrate-binding protein [Planctomonas sp. JC2975]